MNTTVFESHVSAQLDNRIAGKTFDDNAELYSTLDHTTPAYVRDSNCWASELSNITAIAVANESSGDSKRSGILISPRHVMIADHYDIPTGKWIRFVDNDNNIHTYSVVGTKNLDVLYGGSQDIELLYLNEEVDSSLGFAKVMPSGSLSWLDNEAEVPLFSYDVRLGGGVAPHLPRATVVENTKFVSAADTHDVAAPSNVTHPSRYEFYDDKQAGDSGCPICLIVNGELVLSSTFWHFNDSAGTGDGTSVLAMYNHVNTAMTILSAAYGGTNYQLTDVTLPSAAVTVAGKWTL